MVKDNKWMLKCLRAKQFERQKKKKDNKKRFLIIGKEVKEPKISIDERPDIETTKNVMVIAK